MRSDDPIILTCAEARAIDAAASTKLRIPTLLLMENAARGIYDIIHDHSPDARGITVLCGPGNNGGDGLAFARQLAANGRFAKVFLITAGKALTSDADANLQFLKATGITVDTSRDAVRAVACLKQTGDECLIVDCLLGTGVRGSVRPPFDELIAAINSSDADVLAVDVPSGLNSDTGVAEGECVRARRTVTFVGQKQGLLKPSAREWCGQVTVAHIGLPLPWVRSWLTNFRANQI